MSVILTLIAVVVFVFASWILWLLWKYRDRYFGVENRHRFFADAFKDFPIFHNAKTIHQKRKLFEALLDVESSNQTIRKDKGLRLLEIGAGSGANLEFFPHKTKLTVADPNPFFKPFLIDNLKKYPEIELEAFIVTGAEDMKDVPSNSIDAVISTLVLCSVQDMQKTYREISRVLVPGGKFFFMEHVIEDRISLLYLFQKFMGSSGIFQFLVDGCRPDKDIQRELQKASFVSLDIKRFYLDLKELPLAQKVLYAIQPHIYGVATTTK